MKTESWTMIGIGVGGAILAIAVFPAFTIIALNKVSPADVGQVFLGLIFVALIIERATEVYVNVKLEPKKQEKMQPVMAARAEILQLRTALEAERKSSSPNPNMIQGKESELAQAQQDMKSKTEDVLRDLGEHNSAVRAQTSILAMSFGVLAALVGIRALGPFLHEGQLANCVRGAVDQSALDAIQAALKASLTGDQLQTAKAMVGKAFVQPCNVEDWQRRLFSGVDVILTGALLAGGADGLHVMVKRVIDFAKTDTDPLG